MIHKLWAIADGFLAEMDGPLWTSLVDIQGTEKRTEKVPEFNQWEKGNDWQWFTKYQSVKLATPCITVSIIEFWKRQKSKNIKNITQGAKNNFNLVIDFAKMIIFSVSEFAGF